MNRAALVLALVSALCLGSAFGFMGGVVFTRHHLKGEGPMRFGERMHRMGRRDRGEHGIPSARHMVPRLQHMLGLSESQAEAIRGEIERTRGEFANVRDSLHRRIARHLTPEQRERWRLVVHERIPGEPRGRGPRTLRAEPGREGDTSR